MVGVFFRYMAHPVPPADTLGAIVPYVTIRSKKNSRNLTKKNARMGRSGIEKFSLDQLANCGRVVIRFDLTSSVYLYENRVFRIGITGFRRACVNASGGAR